MELKLNDFYFQLNFAALRKVSSEMLTVIVCAHQDQQLTFTENAKNVVQKKVTRLMKQDVAYVLWNAVSLSMNAEDAYALSNMDTNSRHMANVLLNQELHNV